MADLLKLLDGRQKVGLRVHMSDRARAISSMALPSMPLAACESDPAKLWLAPDQWLLVSDWRPAATLVAEARLELTGTTYIATDLTAALRCYELEDANRQAILGFGCGMDFASLRPRQCVRTRLGGISLLLVACLEGSYELYVDTSHAAYFETFINRAGSVLDRAPQSSMHPGRPPPRKQSPP